MGVVVYVNSTTVGPLHANTVTGKCKHAWRGQPVHLEFAEIWEFSVGMVELLPSLLCALFMYSVSVSHVPHVQYLSMRCKILALFLYQKSGVTIIFPECWVSKLHKVTVKYVPRVAWSVHCCFASCNSFGFWKLIILSFLKASFLYGFFFYTEDPNLPKSIFLYFFKHFFLQLFFHFFMHFFFHFFLLV